MKIYGAFIFFILFIIVIPDIYIYMRFIHNRVRKSLGALHAVISAYFIIVSLSILFNINTILSPVTTYHFMTFITMLGAIYIPKLIFVSFDLVFFLKKKRNRNIQYAGYAFAFLSFIAIIYAFHFGKFNFQRKEYVVEIKDLPKSFEGYKILHISDIHLGSFSKQQEKLATLFEKIANENADMIVFSGDMVNNFASEMDDWKPYFKQLPVKNNMLAVLGNHDYGIYYRWENENLEKTNRHEIQKGIRNLGFNLLQNESVIVERGEDKIAFVGIENWGRPPMPQYADFEIAMDPVKDIPVKILLAHDTHFWEDFVVKKEDIALTFSGHTHGAQIGIEIGDFKLSPAPLKYRYWDGLYQVNGQYLIVNRGLGNAGIPARLGMSPEYGVITLKRQ
jgi:predicted MPP superfamily phosphohydrolase